MVVTAEDAILYFLRLLCIFQLEMHVLFGRNGSRYLPDASPTVGWYWHLPPPDSTAFSGEEVSRCAIQVLLKNP
jgi:hypothetical protein